MKKAAEQELAAKKDMDEVNKRVDSIENEIKDVRAEIKIATNEQKFSIIQWMVGLMIDQMAL